jgi:hypothetical protein
MTSIDQTQAQLNTHEQVCSFRYESICARMKRIEKVGMTSAGTIIVLLIGILVNVLQKAG